MFPKAENNILFEETYTSIFVHIENSLRSYTQLYINYCDFLSSDFINY